MYVELALVLAAWLLYQKMRSSQTRKEIPGGASVFAQMKDSEGFRAALAAAARDYAEVGLAKTYIGPVGCTTTWDPRYIEVVARAPQAQRKGNTVNVFFGEIASGVFTHPGGPEWQELRKPIAKAMAPRYIEKEYFKVFLSKSHDMVKHIRQQGEGKLFDISKDLCPLFLDVFFETHLGAKTNEFQDRTVNVAHLIDNAFEFYVNETVKFHYVFWKLVGFFSRPFLVLKDWLDRITSLAAPVFQKWVMRSFEQPNEKAVVEDANDETKNLFFKLFDELLFVFRLQLPLSCNIVRRLGLLFTDRVKDSSRLESYRTTIINLMVETKKKTTNLEGIEGVEYYSDFLERRMKEKKISWKQYTMELADIIVAGTDTTPMASSAAILFLAMFPEVQAAVHQELLEIFGDSDREPTPDDVSRMKVLERVIKETLRHVAPVVIFKTLDGDLTLGEWKLPKGSNILVALEQLHRNPRYWERPADFYPDHFLPENEATRHIYAFMPFGIGQRKCPGFFYAMVAMKVMMSTIIRNFTLSTPLKFDEICFQYKLLLAVKGGYQVECHSR